MGGHRPSMPTHIEDILHRVLSSLANASAYLTQVQNLYQPTGRDRSRKEAP